MFFIILWALLSKKKLPLDEEHYTLKEKIFRSRRIIPVLLLILGILGSIYSGVASPTDAAAVGVVLALVFSWLTGSMNRKTFFAALEGAVLTSCMIAFILAGSRCLDRCHGFYRPAADARLLDCNHGAIPIHAACRPDRVFHNHGPVS